MKGNPSGGQDFKQYIDFPCCLDQEMSGRMYTNSWAVANSMAGWERRGSRKPVMRMPEEKVCG